MGIHAAALGPSFEIPAKSPENPSRVDNDQEKKQQQQNTQTSRPAKKKQEEEANRCFFLFRWCRNGPRRADGEIIELSETLRLFLMFSRCSTEHTDTGGCRNQQLSLFVHPHNMLGSSSCFLIAAKLSRQSYNLAKSHNFLQRIIENYTIFSV